MLLPFRSIGLTVALFDQEKEIHDECAFTSQANIYQDLMLACSMADVPFMATPNVLLLPRVAQGPYTC